LKVRREDLEQAKTDDEELVLEPVRPSRRRRQELPVNPQPLGGANIPPKPLRLREGAVRHLKVEGTGDEYLLTVEVGDSQVWEVPITEAVKAAFERERDRLLAEFNQRELELLSKVNDLEGQVQVAKKWLKRLRG
jgi:hypothetical protein